MVEGNKESLGGVGLFRAPRYYIRDRGITGPAPICIPPWWVSVLRIPDSLEGLDIFLGSPRFLGFPLAALHRLASPDDTQHGLDKCHYWEVSIRG